MNALTATRRYEIDMGHMLPTHMGKCFHAHGHRYAIEATVAIESGGTSRPGESDDGMVMDFADIKRVMAETLEPFDHGFVVCQNDPDYPAMASMTGRNVIAVPYIPTAEALARVWGEQIADELSNYSMTLTEIVVWETPNGHATYRPAP